MKEARQLLSQLVAESRRNKRKRDESLNQSSVSLNRSIKKEEEEDTSEPNAQRRLKEYDEPARAFICNGETDIYTEDGTLLLNLTSSSESDNDTVVAKPQTKSTPKTKRLILISSSESDEDAVVSKS